MGPNYLTSPLSLIITTLFDLYILLVLLRFMLQLFRADFYNPVSQFVVKVTTPVLQYFRKVIPGVGGQDLAAIVLCLVVIYLKFLLLRALDIPAVSIGNGIAHIGAASYLSLVIISIADLVALTLSVFLIAIIIQVILSWINPGQYNPVIGLVHAIAEPVQRPFRRIIPPLGGLDLTPLFASLAIMVFKMLLIPPILYLAR